MKITMVLWLGWLLLCSIFASTSCIEVFTEGLESGSWLFIIFVISVIIVSSVATIDFVQFTKKKDK